MGRPRTWTPDAAVQQHRNLVNRASREAHDSVAEIGPVPAIVDPIRRERARLDLCYFLETYFPDSTGLSPFSDDHHRVIERLQRSILEGGRFCNAVYRGFAKTTISENASLWATFYGHRRFVLIVGINQGASKANIESIRTEIEENDLLLEDFPEVCFPVRALDKKPQRCASQTCGGAHTDSVIRTDTLVLPSIAGSLASSAIIMAKPYGKARGVKFKRKSDGRNARPELIIIDDPQDEESAATTAQVEKNLRILTKGILPSGSHQTRVSVVVNATVIQKGDLVEKLLANPAWQGERIALVKTFADAHKTLWLGKYQEIRRTFDRSIVGDMERASHDATEFYRAHQTEMDAGCVVSWESCYSPDCEISAIQHAYNALIDLGEEAFASEYQNDPKEAKSENALTIEGVCAKVNGIERGRVPKLCQYVSAYIDVHERLLYWAVCGWAPDFGGAVLDYGTYPRQPVSYFLQRSAPVSMSDANPGLPEDSWILKGLEATSSAIVGAHFPREDGAALRVGRLLIDAHWGQKTELVKQFCRRHPQSGSVVWPAMGQYFGATSKPLAEYNNEPGEQRGLHWRIGPAKGGDRHVTIDTNWWKSLAAARLIMPLGTPGGWELFGRDPQAHALFAEHCTAEEPVEVMARGRALVEWKLKPNRDNHWWDCLVGCAVGGSLLGAAPAGIEGKRPRRPRLSLADMARR